MASPPTPASNMNRAVVAFLDGRRLKGFLFNFSPMKETFRLFPDELGHQKSGIDVMIRELKAVFFVKDFSGHPDYNEMTDSATPKHGRKIEVLFRDGEKVSGTTEAYNPLKLGFFIVPIDPNSNNLRIFVVNKNAHQVKMI
ncbi:MAG: hypothetical protein WBP79_02570 [Candidatus Acidiferrales bacterium]